jgi:hypothetical protein
LPQGIHCADGSRSLPDGFRHLERADLIVASFQQTGLGDQPASSLTRRKQAFGQSNLGDAYRLLVYFSLEVLVSVLVPGGLFRAESLPVRPDRGTGFNRRLCL